MRERHFGEAQQVVRPFQNRWIESERAADDELDMTCAVQPETIDFPAQVPRWSADGLRWRAR